MNNGKARIHDDREHWFRDWIKRYESAKTDKKKKERLERQECPYCFYVSSRLGGSAMTSWECALCPRSQTNGSTNTPALCWDCATKEERCVGCGVKMFNP